MQQDRPQKLPFLQYFQLCEKSANERTSLCSLASKPRLHCLYQSLTACTASRNTFYILNPVKDAHNAREKTRRPERTMSGRDANMRYECAGPFTTTGPPFDFITDNRFDCGLSMKRPSLWETKTGRD
jgi:hypothetical protein